MKILHLTVIPAWLWLLSFICLLSSKVIVVEVEASGKNYGHSKLTLFKGDKRFEIDGKSCTVGVAFDKSERFSCACVNGIWGFYGDPCQPPLALVGGHNYCFQMPNVPIRQITTIGSPLRALSDSLTIFEPGMEAVKTKIYRNVHMNLEGMISFVATNSSWTLQGSDGQDAVCLKSVELSGIDDQPMYCTFTNVSSEKIPRIGGLKKGCSEGMLDIIHPMECQPVLVNSSEAICQSLPVLQKFLEKPEGDGNDLDLFRGVRQSFQEWGVSTTTTTTEPPITTTSKYPPGYESAPGWLQRNIRQMVDDGTYDQAKNHLGRSMDAGGQNEKMMKTEAEIMELLKKEWETPMNFIQPVPSNSDKIITDQLWKFEREQIRQTLEIKTGEDMIIKDKNSSSKPTQLLYIARDVMKKLCPVQNPEYFDLITEVFLQIQMKVFRWKEPYVKALDFKRIQAALTACYRESKPLVPKSSCKGDTGEDISVKNSTVENIDNNDINNNGTNEVTPPDPGDVLPMPDTLKSEGMEPIIESMWKIFLSAHSYCYKNFDKFYNDHHKFTTIMVPLFTNEIHKHWFQKGSNSNGSEDYAGIIGRVSSTMSNINECTLAARKHSTFPFHMTRPTVSEKFGVRSEERKNKGKGQVRRKRALKLNRADHFANDIWKRKGSEAVVYAAEASPEDKGSSPVVKDTPKTVEDIPNSAQETLWKNERRILNGMGFCLKKYVEPKLYLHYGCVYS